MKIAFAVAAVVMFAASFAATFRFLASIEREAAAARRAWVEVLDRA